MSANGSNTAVLDGHNPASVEMAPQSTFTVLAPSEFLLLSEEDQVKYCEWMWSAEADTEFDRVADLLYEDELFVEDILEAEEIAPPAPKIEKIKTGPSRLERVGGKTAKAAKKLGVLSLKTTAVIGITGATFVVGAAISSRSDSQKASSIESVAPEVELTAPIIEAAPTLTIASLPEVSPSTTEQAVVPASVTVKPTPTTADLTTTSTVPETTTTLSPEQIAFQSVLSGEQPLEVIGGTYFQVASLRIDGIGLSNADVFVGRDAQVPAPGEAYFDQFDSNDDGVIGKYKVFGTTVDEYAEFQRAAGNPLYRLTTDATPEADTPEVAAHIAEMQQTDSYYQGRATRESRGSKRAVEDAEGTMANQYSPTVVLDQRSVLPGTEGNVVLMGHRTTESAPFATLDMMQGGQDVYITRADGQVFRYQVVASERMYAAADSLEGNPQASGAIENQILNYTGPNGETSTATIYACDPQGSSDYRIVYRLVLVS